MRTRLLSFKLGLITVVLTACPGNEAKPPEKSAFLGDQPTITGTISNWNNSQAATLVAFAYPPNGSRTEVARTSIAPDGKFSLSLPGSKAMSAFFRADICPGTTLIPIGARYTGISFFAVQDASEKIIGGLVYGTELPSMSQSLSAKFAEYFYAEQDLNLSGACNGTQKFAIEAKTGWNTLVGEVVSKTPYTIRTTVSVPPESIPWLYASNLMPATTGRSSNLNHSNSREKITPRANTLFASLESP